MTAHDPNFPPALEIARFCVTKSLSSAFAAYCAEVRAVDRIATTCPAAHIDADAILRKGHDEALRLVEDAQEKPWEGCDDCARDDFARAADVLLEAASEAYSVRLEA